MLGLGSVFETTGMTASLNSARPRISWKADSVPVERCVHDTPGNETERNEGYDQFVLNAVFYNLVQQRHFGRVGHLIIVRHQLLPSEERADSGFLISPHRSMDAP